MKSGVSFSGMLARIWTRLCYGVRHFAAGFRGNQNEYFRQRLGRTAEEAVARHLRRKGYRILERNFSCTGGEIDLIVFRDGIVVFVEVRSVTEPSGLDPLATVTAAKQHRLLRAAQHYVTLRALRRENVVLRFDVVGVRRTSSGEIHEITHIEDAFGA